MVKVRWCDWRNSVSGYGESILAQLVKSILTLTFGGSTPILVPDNCKTAITKNAKEALIVNEQYRRMSEHYGCAVVPARVRKPRDKAWNQPFPSRDSSCAAMSS